MHIYYITIYHTKMTDSTPYTFKNLQNELSTINVTDPSTESLNDYEIKIREAFGYEDKDKFVGLKYLQVGKILDPTKPFLDIVIQKVHTIVMVSKNHKPVNQPVSQPVSQPDNQQGIQPILFSDISPSQTSTSEISHIRINLPSDDPPRTYTLDEIHAVMPFYFMYMMNNRQFIDLYLADQRQFIEIASGPLFGPLVSSLMAQSQNILNSRTNENGRTIVIFPTIDNLLSHNASSLNDESISSSDGSHDIFNRESISNHTNNANDDLNVDLNNDLNVDLNDEVNINPASDPNIFNQIPLSLLTRFSRLPLPSTLQSQRLQIPQMPQILHQSPRQPELNNLGHSQQLLPEDNENIEKLMLLGFSREQCIIAYQICNKNVDSAATRLFYM